MEYWKSCLCAIGHFCSSLVRTYYLPTRLLGSYKEIGSSIFLYGPSLRGLRISKHGSSNPVSKEFHCMALSFFKAFDKMSFPRMLKYVMFINLQMSFVRFKVVRKQKQTKILSNISSIPSKNNHHFDNTIYRKLQEKQFLASWRLKYKVFSILEWYLTISIETSDDWFHCFTDSPLSLYRFPLWWVQEVQTKEGPTQRIQA